jgi:hypothetical protein
MRVNGQASVWLEAVETQNKALDCLIVLCATKPGDCFAAFEAEIIAKV